MFDLPILPLKKKSCVMYLKIVPVEYFLLLLKDDLTTRSKIKKKLKEF